MTSSTYINGKKIKFEFFKTHTFSTKIEGNKKLHTEELFTFRVGSMSVNVTALNHYGYGGRTFRVFYFHGKKVYTAAEVIEMFINEAY